MKSNFTKIFTKEILFSLGLFIGFNYVSQAQVVHEITVFDNEFVPAELTINIGDTVVWTNNASEHNVNGTLAVFPENPEEFGNAVGTNWVYKHKFTTLGSYSYQCDDHWDFGMTGVIIVENSTAIKELNPSSEIGIAPNPATDFIDLQFSPELDINSENSQIRFYDVQGKVLKVMEVNGKNELRIDISNLPVGQILIELSNSERILLRGVFIKQ